MLSLFSNSIVESTHRNKGALMEALTFRGKHCAGRWVAKGNKISVVPQGTDVLMGRGHKYLAIIVLMDKCIVKSDAEQVGWQ